MCPPALQLFTVNRIPYELFSNLLECFLPVSADVIEPSENQADTQNGGGAEARSHAALRYLSRTPFSKADLEQRGTLAKMVRLAPSLAEHYVPCKAKKYLPGCCASEIVTTQRCITILRQVLRLHGYQLLGKQVYMGTGVAKQVIYWVGVLGSADSPDVCHTATPPLDYRKMTMTEAGADAASSGTAPKTTMITRHQPLRIRFD